MPRKINRLLTIYILQHILSSVPPSQLKGDIHALNPSTG